MSTKWADPKAHIIEIALGYNGPNSYRGVRVPALYVPVELLPMLAKVATKNDRE